MTPRDAIRSRVRTAMSATGAQDGPARARSADDTTTASPADPGVSDEALRSATGRGWAAWCELLDAWPGRDDGHTALAAHVQQEHGVQGWWAQTVAVGYERLSGRRLPHQRPDGTFYAGKSRTVTVDAGALRELLLDDTDRAELFPGIPTELRSRPTSKNVRLAIGPGTAEIDVAPRAEGRVTVTIQHERLPAYEDVARWKDYWATWLAALDER